MKDLLLKLGEETIFSAKGHFKSTDLRRNLVTGMIWICMIVNIIGIFGIAGISGKILSGLGLVGTIALLLWNEGEGKNYRARHKEYGELYLEVHKQIRACFYLGKMNIGDVDKLSNRVQEIDKQEKPDIPHIARKWAQNAILKNGETDNWFLNEHQ